MGKLIPLIIIGLAVGMYSPDSRAVLMDKGEPVLRPVLIWNAQREIEKIILGVQQNEQVELRLPAGLGKTQDDIRDVRPRNWRAKGKDKP